MQKHLVSKVEGTFFGDIVVRVNPYNDKYINENTLIRTFQDVILEDLIWHEDLKDRKVEVLEVDKWFFQFDNQMPFELKVGDLIEIPKGMFHRVICSDGLLKLKISEE